MMDEKNKKYKLAGIGEVLWDVMPDGKTIGGSPLNVVYHCQNAGIPSAIISAVGNDSDGREIQNILDENSITRQFIQVKDHIPTGRVTVNLHKGVPDFTIHEDVAWDRISWHEAIGKLATEVDAAVFGSLSQRSQESHLTIQRFIAGTSPDCLRVYDINLRQHYHSRELVLSSLHLCNILKINDEELPVLASYLGLTGSIDEQITYLISTFSLHYVAYTRGANGSVIYSPDEKSELSAKKVKIVDTVGAGDAFTGSMIAGILKGKEMMQWHEEASFTAAKVCEQKGAF